MIEPSDYGLSAQEALARVGDPTRARAHKVFWTQWWQAVTSGRPVLVERHEHDRSDPSATHEFESVRHVRIGCRFVRPEGALRAIVVIMHGYDGVPSLEEQARQHGALAADGLGLLLVRVRGYPGSRLDTPQLPEGGKSGTGWITCGLDVPGEGPSAINPWVVPQAVADVVNACRAARNLLIDEVGTEAHVALMGESLGATLSVVSASLLNGRLPHDPVVERLVFGLPTMSDWPWRQTQPAPATGTGAEIQQMLDRAGEPDRQMMLERLRVMDPVVHAAQVRCPALCKLALRDDTAPAPAAAAVFNALGSDTGRKWRFIVPYGHFDGGLANARRHALFDRCAADFLHPGVHPRDSMQRWDGTFMAGERLADPGENA